jgi:hypothetical protein
MKNPLSPNSRDELDRVRDELDALASLVGAIPGSHAIPDSMFAGLALLLRRQVEALEQVEAAERARLERHVDVLEQVEAAERARLDSDNAPTNDRPWSVDNTIGAELHPVELKALHELAARWGCTPEAATLGIIGSHLHEEVEL